MVVEKMLNRRFKNKQDHDDETICQHTFILSDTALLLQSIELLLQDYGVLQYPIHFMTLRTVHYILK